VNEHQWETVERYGYARQDRCSVCKNIRFYEWTPGWPGWYVYFKNGDKVEAEPPCTPTPVDGLFAGRS
jgi:hypothetical protein